LIEIENDAVASPLCRIVAWVRSALGAVDVRVEQELGVGLIEPQLVLGLDPRGRGRVKNFARSLVAERGGN
jgi:hypothetical protein